MWTITRSCSRRSRGARRSSPSGTGTTRRRRSFTRMPLTDVNGPDPGAVHAVVEVAPGDLQAALLTARPETQIQGVLAGGRGHQRHVDLHQVLNVLPRQPVRSGKSAVERRVIAEQTRAAGGIEMHEDLVSRGGLLVHPEVQDQGNLARPPDAWR